MEKEKDTQPESVSSVLKVFGILDALATQKRLASLIWHSV